MNGEEGRSIDPGLTKRLKMDYLKCLRIIQNRKIL